MRFDTDGLSRDHLSQLSDLARAVTPEEVENSENRVTPLFPYSNAFSHLKPAPKPHKIVIWSLLVFASLVTWYCVVNYGVLK